VIVVAQAYFALLRQQRLTTESQRTLDRAAKLEEMAEARARVGLSTQLDVFRAGIFRSQARAGAMGAANQLAAACEELNILLGRPADAPVTVREDIEADLQIIGPAGASSRSEIADVARRPAAADLTGRADVGDLARRPDVTAAREHLDDLRQQAALAQWNLLPQVNLDVTYIRRGLFGGLLDTSVPGLNGWRVGFSSTYALNQRSDSAAAALAGIAAHSAERSLAETKERAAVDVRRAVRSIEQADELQGLLKHSMELAERQRQLATMRYERGLADNLEVVDAENSVFQAQSALISAEIDRAMSVLLLQGATGTLTPDRFLK
jgi:outer membrane protein